MTGDRNYSEETTDMALTPTGPGLDREVCSRWRLTPGRVLGDRATGTWEATRDGAAFVVKYFDSARFPDWRYTLRVAAALRAQGWPTPEPVEEPLIGPGGAWVLFHRLPGRSVRPADGDKPAEERSRGRLLAEFHRAATATGIVDQRGGFSGPAELVADPGLDHWLRIHELARPDEGRILRACRDAALEWFTDNVIVDAPRSVIHGDFTPWNLLYDDGRLTGVVDFEATHYTFQVADFALSWRGYHDNVLRGYDEVRPLSDLEWQLVRPVFWAWLFIGVKDLLAAHYGCTDPVGPIPKLEWQIVHVRKHSDLLSEKAGAPRLPVHE
ncbi:phosphotransferase enzyme family protein [Dactylosporangium darangshiense]|uniref:phosphotransferase enzyme family protein n=1 Tax=Dactylosporangium darangshiense TaxID=579108 RepID=UPI00362A6798